MSWYIAELHVLLEVVENSGNPFALEKEFQALLKGVAESEYDRGYDNGYDNGVAYGHGVGE